MPAKVPGWAGTMRPISLMFGCIVASNFSSLRFLWRIFLPFADAKDSDKDGMPDVWEDAHGFNKYDPSDATQDADGDGLSNRDEFLLGTDPRKADTDGDGISDGVEVANGSNPLDPNSKPDFAGQSWPTGQDFDGDGLPDPWEIYYRAFSLQPDGDDDGDGVSNAMEALWGTNPFDPNSRPNVNLTIKGGSPSLGFLYQPAKAQQVIPVQTLLTGFLIGQHRGGRKYCQHRLHESGRVHSDAILFSRDHRSGYGWRRRAGLGGDNVAGE